MYLSPLSHNIVTIIPDGCRLPYLKTNFELNVRWFGEIGGNNNENIMWIGYMEFYIGLSYYYAVWNSPTTASGNRNVGDTTHAINFWRDHATTPEVMNLSMSTGFDLSTSSNYFTSVICKVYVRNNSGGSITVATNRGINNADNSICELGTSFMKFTMSMVE